MALFNYECDETKRIIDEVSPNYPQLTTYEKEWLYFHKYGYIPGVPVELEYETVNVNPTGKVSNAIPYQYKSASLKGNTLVNLCNASNRSETLTSRSRIFYCKIPYTIKANSVYTFFAKISNSTTSEQINLQCAHPDGTYSYPKIMDASTNGVVNLPIVNAKDITNILIYISNTDTGQVTVSDVMIIEGDYANVNVPYFKGMQSVQIPVLTTAGKNLFNPNAEFNMTDGSYGFIKLTNNKNNSMSVIEKDSSVDMRGIFFGMTENGKNANEGFVWLHENGSLVAATKTNRTYGYFSFFPNNKTTLDKILQRYDIQFEESVTTTTYEPYKSNILTANEDVVLRGIDNVKDELDLTAGKLTQRICEVALDGIENDSKYIVADCELTNTIRFRYRVSELGFPNTICKCDKMRVEVGYNLDYEHVYVNENDIWFFIEKTKLTANTSQGAKEYLTSNPITVQFQLKTESIKTVDLTKLNKPYEGVNNYYLTANIPCEAVLEVPVVSTGEQTLEEINN